MSDYDMTPEASYQRAVETYQQRVEALEGKLRAAEAREERRARAAQLECDEREAVIKIRTKQRDRLAFMLASITREFEATIQEVDRPKGGMQVPFHGDFASAIRIPSVVSRMRWWAREMRATLGQNKETARVPGQSPGRWRYADLNDIESGRAELGYDDSWWVEIKPSDPDF